MDKSLKEHSVKQLRQTLGEVMSLLEADDVQEVMINGPDCVFVERRGRIEPTPVKISDVSIRAAIQIVARADGSTRDAAENSVNCMVGARLPGYRIAATLLPVSVHGNTMAIRKHNPSNLTLDDYVESGAIAAEQAELLRKAVADHKNIIVAGGTSSGKTTLLNALIRCINHDERILTIEDTQELKVAVPNWVSFEANDQLKITIRDLVKQSLRYRPDRIILGEVRGGEAFDLMQASNTGHDGTFATLHANSATDALDRLETMVLASGINWPFVAIQKNIGKTFNLVVQMARVDGKRQLMEILQIDGYDTKDNRYLTTTLFTRS